jgi:hypothetical protein
MRAAADAVRNPQSLGLRSVPVMAGRRLRAPQEHGAVFAQPPLEEARRLLAHPFSFPDLPIAGRSLRELRQLARAEAVQAAQQYLKAAGQEPDVTASDRIVAAGHQPEIFHPGVWVKDFALCGLAHSAGLIPLNLIVDHDAVKSTHLTLPAWPADAAHDPAQYRLEKVPFDDWPGELPYEICSVRNEALFASLPARAETWVRHWPFVPLLGKYWHEVLRQRERTLLLGERLVAGRRALERQWGCQNLELPVSSLCETEAFAWFAVHLFAGAQSFHSIYNEAVHAYRRVNRLRSRNHPVPDLAVEGDWLEMPLWAWKSGAHRRGRLFVRPQSDGFGLRVGGENWPVLPRDATAFVRTWRALAQEGFKFRSRALTTTLYTRLFVAEVFLHGIGGGKYDELTDELMRRFFGMEPPPFLVLSATLLLPLPGFEASSDQQRRMQRELRDLRWNPQRHLSPGLPGTELAREKSELLERDSNMPPVGWDRHRALRDLTDRMQPFVTQERDQLAATLARVNTELTANEVLRRRDFAFCMYPAETLRPFCQRFL